MKRFLIASLLGSAVLAGSFGCSKDEYSYKTWVDKLDDKEEGEFAVTKLEALGHPGAIDALGKTWRKQGRPVRHLQVIIGLARPLTAAETKDAIPEFPNGRPAAWDKALPYLKEAVLDFDDANDRSLDSAVKAADALGDAGIDEARDTLVEAMGKKYSTAGQKVRLAVTIALGKYNDGSARAALSSVLNTMMDDYETATNDLAKAVEEKDKRGAMVRQRDTQLQAAAAINALAAMRSPEVVPTLLKAAYGLPLFEQVRRALVASGPSIGPELLKVLKGENQEVNALLKQKKIDKYCGDRGELTADKCLPMSLREFNAALVLGDLYDEKYVPVMLEGLKGAGVPIAYSGGMPAGPTQHNAYFASLRRVGSATGAEQLKAMFSDAKVAPDLRQQAIATYAFAARDTSGLKALGDIASSNSGSEAVLREAAATYSRIARTAAETGVLNSIAKTYEEAAAKKRAEADGAPKKVYDANKAGFDAAKAAWDGKNAEMLAAANDKSKSAEDINKARKDADAAKEEFEIAKERLANEDEDEGKRFQNLDRIAKDYRGFMRMFQALNARVAIAIECGDKAECYASVLEAVSDDKAAAKAATEKWHGIIGKQIKDLDKWDDREKKELIPAAIERAMLELGKMGSKAEAQTGKLLAAAKSEHPLIRESVLLALPKIAKLPCTECVEKLDAAIKAGEGKTTLGSLQSETMILRSYFTWAGQK